MGNTQCYSKMVDSKVVKHYQGLYKKKGSMMQFLSKTPHSGEVLVHSYHYIVRKYL